MPSFSASSLVALTLAVLSLASPAAAVTTTRIRCGTDTVCQTQMDPIEYADEVCVNGLCQYRCYTGFAPAPEGFGCVSSLVTKCTYPNQPASVRGNYCTVPQYGYSTCNGQTGECGAGCNVGYTLGRNADNQFFCFDTINDAANCGTVGNVCPESNNGVGTATCKSSTCNISCPAGTRAQKSGQADKPLQCVPHKTAARWA
ncbi:hypothetical protein JCM8547_004730 [Rhodosporidiobolus lusitaniae]